MWKDSWVSLFLKTPPFELIRRFARTNGPNKSDLTPIFRECAGPQRAFLPQLQAAPEKISDRP